MAGDTSGKRGPFQENSRQMFRLINAPCIHDPSLGPPLRKKGFQSIFGGDFVRGRRGPLIRLIPEMKIVAEIGSILIQNPFRLGFTAVVIGAGFVKHAV
jgi:hypothetical protein